MAPRLATTPRRNHTSPKALRRQSPRHGASLSKTQWSNRLAAYLDHHKSCCLYSLRHLAQTPGQSILTWLVVAIALLLPSTLHVSLQNLANLGSSWDQSPKINVFFSRDISPHALGDLRQRLRQHVNVEATEYIDPKRALNELQQHLQVGDWLQSLERNPLPHSLIITPNPSLKPEQLQSLLRSIQARPGVEDAFLDIEWVRKLQQWLLLAQRLIGLFSWLLAIGVSLIIGNTLRLTIENHHREIVITKLVGGTNAFVRRPFLYIGWWYGVVGGLLAGLLLNLGLSWVKPPVVALATLYQSSFQLQTPSFLTLLTLLFGGGLLGWIGAWIAIWHQLKAIEPS